MPDFDLDTFLPYRLAIATSDVSREFADRYRERFDISVPEWRVMAHLSHTGRVSVREITARVRMEKSRVSRAAARLVSRGLAAKVPDPRDGRLVVLSLTEAGLEMMSVIAAEADSYQAELSARLGMSEAEICDLLKKFSKDPDAQ